MKRLTTDTPDNNLDAALNLFYVKDGETWVRGGGDGPDYPDIRLYDFIRKAAKILMPDLDFPMDDDGVDMAMGELLLDGPDEPTGLLALLYTAAWAYAELRGRLMQYEDTGMMPDQVDMDHEAAEALRDLCRDYDLGRLESLAEADKAGRLVVLPCKVGDTVWFKTYTDNGRTCIGMQPHKVVGTRMCVMAEGGIFPVELLLASFGETWFLTREEAEKALEAKRDGVQ